MRLVTHTQKSHTTTKREAKTTTDTNSLSLPLHKEGGMLILQAMREEGWGRTGDCYRVNNNQTNNDKQTKIVTKMEKNV